MSQVLALNTQVNRTQHDYETLLQRKQQLSEQLTAVQFTLMDSSSAEVVEHINQLQLEQTKQQGIVQHAQQILQQLQPQLEQAEYGAEQILLEAISIQRIYGFKNKREIVFDSHVGMLFANLYYVPLISYDDWKAQQKNFAPDGIAKGQWQCLHNYFYRDKNGVLHGYGSEDWYNTSFLSHLPKKFQCKEETCVIYYHYDAPTNSGKNYKYYYKDGSTVNVSNPRGDNSYKILPSFHILNNEEIFANYPRTTALEKAKIILDFFIEQEWIPEFETTIEFLANKVSYHFEDDEERQEYVQKLDNLYASLLQRHQLQKQLVEIEQQLAELPEPAQTWLSADFNYRPVLAQYPLTEIAQSVWQYSLSAQHWLNTLLEQLDEWESEHSDVITTAQSINAVFAEKLQLSSQLNEQECAVLNEQHQYLKQKLNFSLIPTKQKLIALLEQNQQLEQKLEQTDDLQSLAELEQYSRPSFPLLAEHSATLCTKNLASLEWLEQNLTFVQDVVASAEQQREQYLIFVDKYLQDLQKEASDNSIEDEHIQKWLAEWRTERLTLLQQWLPLVKAGLQHELTQETVRSTLACLVNYQEQIDQFYLKSRLGVHTKFAFTANGHRQEQLEKDSELIKLNHQFMQALQTVIFSLSSSREKLWLLNYSEVWQKHIVQEIQVFLQNENLLERDDIAQLMMDEMRKVQQQSLASCLQDAEHYSEALEQRNKSVNTLIFKMRKALSAEK